MAFGAEQSCLVNSNSAMPRVVRRRPKLVPPKLKRFTRARINLNHVWPLVDSESDFCESETSPLQSSTRFNCVGQLPYSIQRPSRGNDVFCRVQENTENLSAFVQVPTLKRGDSTGSLFSCGSRLNEKLHLISCSAPASQGFQLQKDTQVAIDGHKNFELPLVSLDDLAAVLSEYERQEQVMPNTPCAGARDVQNQQARDIRCAATHVELHSHKRRLLRDSPSFHHLFSHRVSSLENDVENFAS